MNLRESTYPKPATPKGDAKDDEKFVELVEKFETKHKASSTAGIYRDVRWTALKVIASIMFCDRFLLFLTVGILWFCYAFPFDGIITWVLVGGFVLLYLIRFLNLLKFGPRDGVALRIKRNDSPRLFDLIDQASAKMKTPVHRVFVVPEHNSWAAYERRWLFWKTNDLHLGWPMMMTISEEGLLGLLGHEFFHFGKYQSSDELLNRAVVATWHLSQISLLKSQQDWHLKQYQRLIAYTTVLGKRNEILADEASIRLTSPATEATYSFRFAVVGEYLKEHSPMSKPEFAMSAKQPPKDMMSLYRQDIQNAFRDESTARKLFEDSIKSIHTSWEHHPTWLQRILTTEIDWQNSDFLQRAVNYQPATEIFTSAKEIEDKLNEKVFEQKLPGWETNYEFEKNRQQYLVPSDDVDDFDDAMQHAYATMNRSELEQAEPWLRRALEFKPEDQVAQCYLSMIDLKKENDGAEEKLETLVNSPSLVAANLAYESLLLHYQKTGNQTALTQLESRLDEIQDRQNAIQKELQPNYLRPFIHHDLIAASLESVCKSFAKHKSIQRVYAGRQQLESCPDTQFIIFAAKLSPFSFVNQEKLLNELLGEIYIGGTYFWLEVHTKKSALQKKLIKIDDSEIYRSK